MYLKIYFATRGERMRNTPNIANDLATCGPIKSCYLSFHGRAEPRAQHKLNCQVNNLVTFIY